MVLGVADASRLLTLCELKELVGRRADHGEVDRPVEVVVHSPQIDLLEGIASIHYL